MKKKSVLISILMAFVLAASLCACGGSGNGGSGSKEEKPAEAAAAEEKPAEAAAAEEKPAEAAAAEEKPAEAAAAEEKPAEAAAAEEKPAEEAAEEKPAEAAPAEEKPAEEPAPEKAEVVPEGEYRLIAIENEGITVDPTSIMEGESILTLNEDGTGHMTLEGEEMEITSWALDGEVMTLTAADGSSIDGEWKSGLLKLVFMEAETYSMYYAKEDADLSGLEILTPEEALSRMGGQESAKPAPESLLGTFWGTMDPEKGIHLNYEYYVASMDSTSIIDAYGKGGQYYSSRTTKVSGYETETATVISEDKVYNLDPADKTGTFVMEVPSIEMIKTNGMLLDNLYQAVWNRYSETDFTEEEQEIDGVTYMVATYPKGRWGHEDTFCFDTDGRLVKYVQGEMEGSSLNLGEIVYTVHLIDDQVDETLFSIEGYQISE